MNANNGKYANSVAVFLPILGVGLDPHSARIATYERSNGYRPLHLRTHCRSCDNQWVSPLLSGFCTLAFLFETPSYTTRAGSISPLGEGASQSHRSCSGPSVAGSWCKAGLPNPRVE